MVDLGKGMKPIVMPHYPHMLAEDVEVWSEYLKSPVIPVKEVWYDVRVGGAVDVGADGGELLRRISRGLTRKRIDVVARVGGGFWIIEVKPFGSMLALGQVLSYLRLFVREYRTDGEVWPVVVCRQADRDLLDEFEAAGVAVIEV